MGHVVACPNCRQSLTVPKLEGSFVCPQCRGTFAAPVPVKAQPIPATVLSTQPAARPGLFNLVKRGITSLVDPNRSKRIQSHASDLHAEMGKQKDAFELAVTLEGMGVVPDDREEVIHTTYRSILQRAWIDAELTDREVQSLKWCARALQLGDTAKRLEWDAAIDVFEQKLAAALNDGVLQPEELQHLERIASRLGMPLAQLTRNYFSNEAHGFLRSMFLAATGSGVALPVLWDRLVQPAGQLGFSQDEFAKVVAPQSQQLVEHVLADAKADGVLAQEEDRELSWLLQHFWLSPEFRAYLEQEIAELRRYTDVRHGKLPTLLYDIGVSLRAGEIAHFCAPASFQSIRRLKSGTKVDELYGKVVITDTQILFSSAEKSFRIRYSNILECNLLRIGVEVRNSAKPSGWFDFGSENRWAHAVLKTAIGKAHQTIVERQDGLPNRHIPRDVRQRVWQRYSGQCAECSSSQYLEYDHIVPVAKGGSNSENNVQLLCRGCNLKKSDRI